MIIEGKLSVLTKGLKNPEEIIGKPMKAEKVIGTVIGIDVEKDVFIVEIKNHDFLNAAIMLGADFSYELRKE